MKKVSVFAVLLVMIQFMTPSCSKKSSPAPACKLITLVDGSSTYNLTYNNDGKISTLISTNGTTTTTKIFTYLNSTLFITTTSSGGGSSTTDSLVLNSAGFILSDLERNGTDKTVTTFTYGSNNEALKSVAQTNSDPAVTTQFTFTNGDMTSLTSGSSTTAYIYDDSKPTQTGDYLQVVQLVQYGAPYIKSTHLISGFQPAGGTIENINYTFDNTGKISGLTATGGSSVETLSYQYQCN